MNNQSCECSDIIYDTEKKFSQKKLCGIYGLQNKLDPSRWNIGQSREIYTRWHNAYELIHCKNQRKLYNALLKYGYNGFEKRVIELCDSNIPQEMLDLKETAWIKHFNSVEHGYNLDYGGSRGKHSEETKQRIRNAVLEIRKTPEQNKHSGESLSKRYATLAKEKGKDYELKYQKSVRHYQKAKAKKQRGLTK